VLTSAARVRGKRIIWFKDFFPAADMMESAAISPMSVCIVFQSRPADAFSQSAQN